MPRVKRLLVTDCMFFVTVNLRRRIPAFGPEEFAVLIAVLEEARRKLRFRLCGYVLMPDHWHALMPDHWHALIGVDHPLTISRAVQDVKWTAAQRVGKLRHAPGPLWQHQFWDRFVRHGKEFGHRLAYMHSNPVRKGLVRTPEEWTWSSHHNFSLDPERVAQCPIQIDYSDM